MSYDPLPPIERVEGLLTEALDVADTMDAPLLAAKIDEALTCAHEIAGPKADRP